MDKGRPKRRAGGQGYNSPQPVNNIQVLFEIPKVFSSQCFDSKFCFIEDEPQERRHPLRLCPPCIAAWVYATHSSRVSFLALSLPSRPAHDKDLTSQKSSISRVNVRYRGFSWSLFLFTVAYFAHFHHKIDLLRRDVLTIPVWHTPCRMVCGGRGDQGPLYRELQNSRGKVQRHSLEESLRPGCFCIICPIPLWTESTESERSKCRPRALETWIKQVVGLEKLRFPMLS